MPSVGSPNDVVHRLESVQDPRYHLPSQVRRRWKLDWMHPATYVRRAVHANGRIDVISRRLNTQDNRAMHKSKWIQKTWVLEGEPRTTPYITLHELRSTLGFKCPSYQYISHLVAREIMINFTR